MIFSPTCLYFQILEDSLSASLFENAIYGFSIEKTLILSFFEVSFFEKIFFHFLNVLFF